MDEFGMPLQSDPYAAGAAPAASSGGVVSEAIAALRDVFLGGQAAVTTIVTGGQDTVENVFVHGQDTVGEVALGAQDTAKTVLNPFGLLGLGAGVSFGGVLALTGVVGGGALLADELATGGVGRMALMRRLGAGKRR